MSGGGTLEPTADVHAFLKKLTTLSPITREQYIDRLKVLERGLEKEIYAIIKDAKQSIAWIRAQYKSDVTQKALFSVVLSVFRHVPGVKEKYATAHTLWVEAFQKVDTAIEERYNKNEPTQKQRDGYVPYPDFIKMRDKLDKGTIERLLLAMYTYIRPLRADYNKVRLYKSVPAGKHEPNYISMTKAGCHMHLEEYKTAKTYGAYELDLPAALCAEIHASLDKWPRQYLFTMKNDVPFHKPNSFTKWANRILQSQFEPKTPTLTMLRHSYINTLDFNKLTVAERMEEAKLMAHNKDVQEIYRLHMDK
jgi:hypothetical protein